MVNLEPDFDVLSHTELVELARRQHQQLEKISRNEQILAANNQILEYVSKGAKLEQVLSLQCVEAERLYPGMQASVLQLDENKQKLHHCAAVSLPAFYLNAIDGIEIGEGVGSCGTAAFRGERVVVDNIASHPYWDAFKHLAIRAGLRACWSEPIISPSGEIFGTFAMYYSVPMEPEKDDLAYIANQARVAGIVFAHDRAEKSLGRQAEILESRVAERTSELEKSLTALTNAQEQLIESEKNSAIGLLVASIAHDVNTPLGIALTASSSLKQQVLQVEQELDRGSLHKGQLLEFLRSNRDLLSLTEKNLQRGIDIVSNLKNVSVDQSSHQKRQFALKAYLEEVAFTLMPKLRKKSIEVRIDCDPELQVETYPGDLFQILTNLMLNSEIHGFVNTKEPIIQIDVVCEQQKIQLDYRDNGSGMSEDIRLHVFEPFVTSKQEQGSSGLGMHIVYSLLTQKLKGKIQTLNPGVGVHFQLSFPARI